MEKEFYFLCIAHTQSVCAQYRKHEVLYILGTVNIAILFA